MSALAHEKMWARQIAEVVGNQKAVEIVDLARLNGLFDPNKENERLRAALMQVRATCEGNAAPTCDKGMALAFVGDVARHALDM